MARFKQAYFKMVCAFCLGILNVASSAQAASFNCAKAASKVEHIICDTPELSILDDEMSRRFKSISLDKTKSQEIRLSQKWWIEERNGCTNSGCLKSSYQTRIHALTQMQKHADTDEYVLAVQDPEKTSEYLSHIKPDPEVCQLYLENLNYFAHKKKITGSGLEKIRKNHGVRSCTNASTPLNSPPWPDHYA